MSKNLVIAIVVSVLVVAGAGAFWYFNHGTAGATLASDGPASTLPPDTIGPDEHVMGSATAPVTVIEYFSQGCSVCSHFDQTVFSLVKAKYIDTGKIRYVMRLFPLFPIDGPAYKLDLCVPKENFFAAADLLFRNQQEWDSGEFPIADPHAGLIKMARTLGLSAEQADACMNSTAHDDNINKVAQDATARYNPTGTPTFIFDYKKVILPGNSWEDFQAAADAALKAKGAK